MKIKTQKGSVTIFVLITLLFLMALLLLLYANNLNKVQTITEKAETLKNIYSKNYNNIEEVYNRNKGPQVGDIVKYNVTYKDMYSGITYTADNGWRYLGEDDNGNNLIVSTGIPAILYYHYNSNIGNIADGGVNAWWATKAEISTTTDTLYKTDKGYNHNTDSGEPNKYAAYGLRYKFESIPFTYQSSGTSLSKTNAGIYRQVGTQTSGRLSSTAFRAEGIEIIDVHNLTLAELNRATNSASGSSRADTATSSGFKDLTGKALGLFDMRKLENYGTSTTYSYWLSSPPNSTNLHHITSNLSYLYGHNSLYMGVRPVITLNSNAKLVKDTVADTWSIQ